MAALDGWALDPAIHHLNHGSFGAVRTATEAHAAGWRARLTRAPMRFFGQVWSDALAAARTRVAAELGADADGLVFVANASAGVATALAQIVLAPGDELVLSHHTYRACRLHAEQLAARAGARVIYAVVPARPQTPADTAAGFIRAMSPRTRVVLIDHVSSPTAIVFDARAICAAARAHGAITIVDGAHGPGQLDVDIAALGCEVYVGNAHKWWCTPLAVGFMWMSPHLRATAWPLVTSHGADPTVGPAHRYFARHDWTGTHDPSAILSLPFALDELAAAYGGWPAIRAANHALACAAAEELAAALGTTPTVPATLCGSMRTVPVRLPDGVRAPAFEARLLDLGWEVLVPEAAGQTYVRVAAHRYNEAADYRALATLLLDQGVRGATV